MARPKAAVVVNFGWFGTITYAGIGAVSKHSTTSDWLADILTKVKGKRLIED
jgi:hypothetical protein